MTELTVPAWLNEKFLETVFQEEEINQTSIAIIDYDIKSVMPPGSNYSSDMFRVRVVYSVGNSRQEQVTSVIIKVPVVEGVFKEIEEYFSREPIMYEKQLPAMSKKINHEFAPKSFHSPLKNVLVLKDLKDEGYVIADKFKQLDYPHCELVFKTVAKFHAASLACYHDDLRFIEGVSAENFYIEGGTSFRSFMEGFVNQFGKAFDVFGVADSFKRLFNDRVGRLWDSGVMACKPKETGSNVLVHGDLWCNNLMFKYDGSGNLLDVKFLDYQRTKFCSPVVDLLYFLWSSANSEVLDSRQKELYSIYLETLNSTLEHLGSEARLSEEELQDDLRALSDWALICLCFTTPLMLAEPDNALDLEAIELHSVENDENTRKVQQMYGGKHAKTLIPRLTRSYEKWVNGLYT
ncbi:uncharacterized protein LOC124353589 [Homalodisca vitripennis]|uniref:uncharacterized protein LOC124353589 n=1 Tax=Homalodisca vitripennis TaxID=197043 RepID=UPI001EE9E97F|nr:uncharacterized protein LOC124353589 [Homalodisca vitripennis]